MSGLGDLADYRRRVADLYAQVRRDGEGEEVWASWRAGRDELFATHPQTPLDDPAAATTTPFFPYDPAYRVLAPIRMLDGVDIDLGHSGEGATGFVAFATATVDLPTGEATLTLYWLRGYGGGVFLPFRDATNGFETYGGGRYLLDAAKGADLGGSGDRVMLDFNYAYHPSCVYSPRWSCPLAPPANHLAIPVRAGERLN